MAYMSPAQASAVVQANKARYVASKDGIAWYRMPDTSWIAWRQINPTQVELRHLPPGSCGCS